VRERGQKETAKRGRGESKEAESAERATNSNTTHHSNSPPIPTSYTFSTLVWDRGTLIWDRCTLVWN